MGKSITTGNSSITAGNFSITAGNMSITAGNQVELVETEIVSRNQKELVMSDLGTSNAVRGSKMARQDKMKIEKVVSCDEKFCLG